MPRAMPRYRLMGKVNVSGEWSRPQQRQIVAFHDIFSGRPHSAHYQRGPAARERDDAIWRHERDDVSGSEVGDERAICTPAAS